MADILPTASSERNGLLRTASIKRTPSDLSRSLAEADLPPPSAITAAGRAQASEAETTGVNAKLGELDLDEPEGECGGILSYGLSSEAGRVEASAAALETGEPFASCWSVHNDCVGCRTGIGEYAAAGAASARRCRRTLR